MQFAGHSAPNPNHVGAIDGDTLDTAKLWEPTPKNQIIRASNATNRLRVGGTGSSKTSDSLMEAVTEYMMRWDGLAVLFLRRTLKELTESAMLDFAEFVPAELYKWNRSTDPVTLYNGSKLFWGHLPNNSEKDLHRFLSAAFPVIVFDECGQFSPEAWAFMSSRNRVNRECQPNERGEFPVPVMLGNTNPLGAYWSFYNAQFVKKKPYEAPEGARRDKNGRYWVEESPGNWTLVYNPDDWDYVHSTLLDNPHLLRRDPDLHRKLMALPKLMRERLLEGKLDAKGGLYFDCWDEDRIVVSLAKDPDAVIWQPWQPRWMGWDWGRAHWTSVYWFTVALVRTLGGEYKEKIVCYREYVDRGKGYAALCHNVAAMTKMGLPGYTSPSGEKAWSVQVIYLSHEKFTKLEGQPHAPAHEISGELMRRGLPGATRNNASPGSRVGKATLMHDKLEHAAIAILDSCNEIIESIPDLKADPDNLEDVLKVDGKPDDCYDGFSMALYNFYANAKKPEEVKDAERIDAIEDPLQKRLEQFKLTAKRQQRQQEPERKPEWM